jgi:signal transduction histidine kinase
VFLRVRASAVTNPDDASTAARMRALAQLARPTAHELRGTLSSMTLHLQLLANALNEQGEQAFRARSERYLAVVRDECGRLQRIAEAFLDLVALPGNGGEVDLADVVRSVVDAVRPLAAGRRVRLELGECAPQACELPDREASRQRLLDAVLERLATAPAGSVVRLDLLPASRSVSVAVADAAPVHVGLLASAERGDA